MGCDSIWSPDTHSAGLRARRSLCCASISAVPCMVGVMDTETAQTANEPDSGRSEATSDEEEDEVLDGAGSDTDTPSGPSGKKKKKKKKVPGCSPAVFTR